ncbi:MAG: PIN domain nuclease [Actinomycetota bacterium]
MILVDTSAWIEFLRDTGSPTCVAVDDLLSGELATCDPVFMEVLAGARSERHLTELRGLLARAVVLRTDSSTYDHAAALYRSCRAGGETVRKMLDCLIAATAIEAGAEVLHSDSDFSVLERHTALRTYRAAG